MIIRTKTYWVTDGCPSKEDLEECMKIVAEENIRIELKWFGPDNRYYGGFHSIFVNPGDDYETLDDRLPKMYGL